MANKDLSLEPHNIKNPMWWWYEENGGIRVYHQPKIGDEPEYGTISWRSIRAALKRKDKARAKGE